ncbi:MAG: hypothetical protein G01um1014106_741 [Parcubacteria group bacterium Gr01-1014_106]|nr:MAG: hypothetical protein G01um1014106_741 [Parcubacteria group bacterium Gr01-1014_106]
MPKRVFILALVGTALLTALFFSVLRREDATLGTPLIDTSILPDVRWSDVRHTQGTVLRGDLSEQTLTPANSPYLLEGTVRIPRATVVRVAPHTLIAAADGARIVVEGTLDADRATFTNTHLHPQRRLWHGLVVERGGILMLRKSGITDASAGATCAAGGSLRITDTSISTTAAGIVTLPGCATATIERVSIADGRVGLYLLGGTPAITALTLTRVFDGMRVFHEARPAMTGVTARALQHALVVYAAEPNLVVRNLTLPPNTDAATLMFDGADTPKHRWNDHEYSTGRVLIEKTRS